MNREELNKVVHERFKDSDFRTPNMYCFIQGAEWLQSQPLSDRLTEEEKEKINNLCEEIWSMNDNVARYGENVVNWLIRIETKFQRIFGTEPLKS